MVKLLAEPKLPEPEEDQLPVLVPPLTLPVSVIADVLEHTNLFPPAFVTAIGLIRIATVSVTAGQTLLFVEVSVKITTPFRISAPLNAYTGASAELLLNVPEPEVDHDAVFAVPFNDSVFCVAHTILLVPAFTMAS